MKYSHSEIKFWGYIQWLCLWGANATDAPLIAFETFDVRFTRAMRNGDQRSMGRKATAE